MKAQAPKTGLEYADGAIPCSQIGHGVIHYTIGGVPHTTVVDRPKGISAVLVKVFSSFGETRRNGGIRWFLFAALLRLTALLVRERIGEDNAK